MKVRKDLIPSFIIVIHKISAKKGKVENILTKIHAGFSQARSSRPLGAELDSKYSNDCHNYFWKTMTVIPFGHWS